VLSLQFSGSFDAIIGNRSEEFLSKCSTYLLADNVQCADVYSGSVIVTLVGEQSALEEVGGDIIYDGVLDVPNFPLLLVESIVETRPETLDRVSSERHASPVTITDIDVPPSSRSVKSGESSEDQWNFEAILWCGILAAICCCFCIIVCKHDWKTTFDFEDDEEIQEAGMQKSEETTKVEEVLDVKEEVEDTPQAVDVQPQELNVEKTEVEMVESEVQAAEVEEESEEIAPALQQEEEAVELRTSVTERADVPLLAKYGSTFAEFTEDFEVFNDDEEIQRAGMQKSEETTNTKQVEEVLDVKEEMEYTPQAVDVQPQELNVEKAEVDMVESEVQAAEVEEESEEIAPAPQQEEEAVELRTSVTERADVPLLAKYGSTFAEFTENFEAPEGDADEAMG